MKARRRQPPDLLRHAPWLAQFPSDAPYIIGVSGGRDSVALLHALATRGDRLLIVAHLDHGLRTESGEDARFVADLAAKLGAKVVLEKQDVATRARKQKRSIETAAREARREFLQRLASEHGVAGIFLAHHADDQVETFLFNLFRGGGAPGLAAMAPVSPIAGGVPLLRPLLPIWREEIDTYISVHGLSFREDESNSDPRYTRNRLRGDIIPSLSASFGRDVRTAIWRTAEILREENSYLDGLPELTTTPAQPSVPVLRALSIALQRRFLHRWLKAHGVAEVDFDDVERVRALLEGGVAKTNLSRGWHARRRAGKLFLERGRPVSD